MSGFSLTLTATQNERDQLVSDLWDAGTTGITEDEHWLRAFFTGESDSQVLLRQFADFRPVFEEQEDYDWIRHSQEMWQPFQAGTRFWLVPEWQDDPTPAGLIRLPIRPGLACGSGSHPATRLCLEALESVVHPDARVLDVGTGSGILAEAAGLLGAGFVVGCDIDHDSTLIAHRNVPSMSVFTGSLRSVRSAGFDVVVANLNAATVTTIAADLQRVARGAIILSGFRESEQERLLKALPAPKKTLELDGWACVVC